MDTRQLLTAVSGHRWQAGLAGMSSWWHVVRGGGYEVGPASSEGTAWRTEAQEPGEGQAQGKLASSVNSATRCRPGQAAVGTGRQEWESLSRSHFLARLVLVPMRTLAQME